MKLPSHHSITVEHTSSSASRKVDLGERDWMDVSRKTRRSKYYPHGVKRGRSIAGGDSVLLVDSYQSLTLVTHPILLGLDGSVNAVPCHISVPGGLKASGHDLDDSPQERNVYMGGSRMDVEIAEQQALMRKLGL